MNLKRVRSYRHSIAISAVCCFVAVVAHVRTISDAELEVLQRILISQTDPERLGCAYTMHSFDERRGTISERFDPYFEGENPWSLIQIDGAQPTVEQLDSYRPIERERHPAILQFELIDPTTLQGLSLVGNKANYKFRTRHEFSATMNMQVEGTMAVDLFAEEISEMRIAAPKPFRINDLTKIEQFDQLMRFKYEPLVGPVLSLLVVRLSGQTMGEKFDGSLSFEFEDFDCSARAIPRSAESVLNPGGEQNESGEENPSMQVNEQDVGEQ